MLRLLIVLTALTFVPAIVAAESFSFAEVRLDTLVCTRSNDEGLPVSCDLHLSAIPNVSDFVADVNAFAFTERNELHAFASFGITGKPGNSPSATASGIATITESVRAVGGSGPGFVRITGTLSGDTGGISNSGTWEDGSLFSMLLSWNYQIAALGVSGLTTTCDTFGAGVCQIDVPVIFDQSFQLRQFLGVGVSGSYRSTNANGLSGLGGFVDASDTAGVTGVEIFDQQMNRIPGARLVSVSDGWEYPSGVTAVPEPASLSLLLAGLGAAAVARRRRKTQTISRS